MVLSLWGLFTDEVNILLGSVSEAVMLLAMKTVKRCLHHKLPKRNIRVCME